MGNRRKGVMRYLTQEAFTGIYAEIAAEIGSETAVKIYQMLHGQVVIFPQKLYSGQFVRSFILEHYPEYSIREIATMFGYSDRRIRQIIAELKAESDKE